MDEELRFNPYEGVEIEELFGAEEHDNHWKFQTSHRFFEPDGHSDAFEPHPLAWESIPYRSRD